MLRHIPAVLSPDLVKALMEMGEGDEIVLGEAGLPAHSVHPQVLRADGVEIADLLAGVLALMPLDTTAEEQVLLLGDDEGAAPACWATYAPILGDGVEAEVLPRAAFYENMVGAAVIVVTGTRGRGTSIALRKGGTLDES